MSQYTNIIKEYYTPDDKRLAEYYSFYFKLLGLEKHPFGLDQNGCLRFEEKESNSRIYLRYKELGGIEGLNTLWIEMQRGQFTLDELMQLYRETGSSLGHMIDTFSDKFYVTESKKELERALVELEGIEHIEVAQKAVLEDIFLAHLNSADDELIFNYRKEAKKIINKNFWPGAWEEFINSIKNKNGK